MFHCLRMVSIVPSEYIPSIASWIFAFRSVLFGSTAMPTGCGSIGSPMIWSDGSLVVYHAAGGESDS